jgi:LEA14-like dessication related protein
MRRSLLIILAIVAALGLSTCASLQRDPVQVTVADIESLPGEGLEFRMLVKLRVQNPNDAPVEYDGVYLKLDVQNRTFATGVSDERGNVPRFGETIIGVPVTVSALRLAAHALGFMLDGMATDKVSYKLEEKLDGPVFGSTRFQANGEFSLPTATPSGSKP